MKKIGLTGGIGAGKSFVAHILELMNYPVFYSDREAKKIMNFDSEVRDILIQRYGEECYQNEQLNRPFLAKIIFSQEEEKEFINQLIHPRVRRNLKILPDQVIKTSFLMKPLFFLKQVHTKILTQHF